MKMNKFSPKKIFLVYITVTLCIHLGGADDFNHQRSDDAEKFRGKELLILEKDLPSTKLEEYYLFELENLKVVNEENELLGRIDQIMKTGANDVLVVKPSSKSVDRIERLVPFTKREVVKEVDLKSKVVYVKWPKDY